MRRIHSISSLAISLGLFLAASPAFAGDTFFVDSASGNDANTCLSADQACLTISQARTLLLAQTNPQNSTLKLAGTFVEAIDFDNDNVTAPDTLDGLRVTATDKSSKPTIDATGNDYGVQVTEINDVTVDHLIVTGSKVGISVTGYSTSYVSGISIHHNQVTALIADPGFTGIELWIAKESTVEHNNVHDIAITTTDNSTYTTSQGYYLFHLRNVVFRHNQVDHLTTDNTLATVATGHSNYLYGLYSTTLVNVTIKHNTISNILATETSNLVDNSQTSYVDGLFVQAASNLVVTHNTIDAIAATTEAAGLDGTSSYNQVVGLYLSDLRSGAGSNIIQNNTITGVSATQQTDTGNAYAYGMRVEYVFSTLLDDNTINGVNSIAGGSLPDGNYSATVYGISGPHYGSNNTVSNNTIKALDSTTDFTGATSYGYANTYGVMSTYSPNLQVIGNTVRNLTWLIDSHGGAEAMTYPYLIGISATYANTPMIRNNTIRDLGTNYTTTSAGYYLGGYAFGLYTTYSDGAQLQGNTIRQMNFDFTFSDASNTASGNHSVYPVYASNSSGVTVTKNRAKHINVSSTQADTNPIYLYLTGYNLLGSDGSFTRNKLLNSSVTNTAGGAAGGNYVYGAALSGLGQTIIDHNVIKTITAEMTNAGTQYFYGFNITAGKPLYVNANAVRDITTTSTSAQSVYGLALALDASKARVTNNILLGDSSYTGAGTYTGLYLPSSSTTDLDVVNNTIADWRYPVQLEGGNQVLLLNNIFAAITDTGYAMAIKYNHVNLDNFKSDYNLLYNPLGKTEAIYDLDASAAIHFGDWSNKGGSYGYDLHSRYHTPKLTATGRLQTGSKAIDHGSKAFNYSPDELVYTLIHSDIDDAARPGANGKVDIGAAELD